MVKALALIAVALNVSSAIRAITTPDESDESRNTENFRVLQEYDRETFSRFAIDLCTDLKTDFSHHAFYTFLGNAEQQGNVMNSLTALTCLESLDSYGLNEFIGVATNNGSLTSFLSLVLLQFNLAHFNNLMTNLKSLDTMMHILSYIGEKSRADLCIALPNTFGNFSEWFFSSKELDKEADYLDAINNTQTFNHVAGYMGRIFTRWNYSLDIDFLRCIIALRSLFPVNRTFNWKTQRTYTQGKLGERMETEEFLSILVQPRYIMKQVLTKEDSESRIIAISAFLNYFIDKCEVYVNISMVYAVLLKDRSLSRNDASLLIADALADQIKVRAEEYNDIFMMTFVTALSVPSIGNTFFTLHANLLSYVYMRQYAPKLYQELLSVFASSSPSLFADYVSRDVSLQESNEKEHLRKLSSPDSLSSEEIINREYVLAWYSIVSHVAFSNANARFAIKQKLAEKKLGDFYADQLLAHHTYKVEFKKLKALNYEKQKAKTLVIPNRSTGSRSNVRNKTAPTSILELNSPLIIRDDENSESQHIGSVVFANSESTGVYTPTTGMSKTATTSITFRSEATTAASVGSVTNAVYKNKNALIVDGSQSPAIDNSAHLNPQANLNENSLMNIE